MSCAVSRDAYCGVATINWPPQRKVPNSLSLSLTLNPQSQLLYVPHVISMLALSFYFQLVRRSHLHNTGCGMIMAQPGLAALPVFLLLSWTSGEHWGAGRSLSVGGWLAVSLYLQLQRNV